MKALLAYALARFLLCAAGYFADAQEKDSAEQFRASLFPLAGLTDAQLKNFLAGRETLKILNLHQALVTNEGMKDVARFTKLQDLSLGMTRVDDHGLKHLVTLQNLTNLCLWNRGNITNAGMETVAKFRRLRSLDVHNNTQVGDPGMQHIATSTELRILGLSCTAITDDGFRRLATLTRLQDLNLCHTRVSDASIKTILGFKELKKVWLFK